MPDLFFYECNVTKYKLFWSLIAHQILQLSGNIPNLYFLSPEFSSAPSVTENRL